MAGKVVNHAKKRLGQRIVVLTGCEHRYILRDLLSKQSEIRFKEFHEVPAYKP